MNIKIVFFQSLLILSTASHSYSEKKKQLTSNFEVIASIDENISHLMRFARAVSTKKSEQAKKKCTIALKNLKTLNYAIENGSIYINPVTNIAMNGLIWHPDPCNNPDKIIKHIELYDMIRLSKLFSQISDLKYNNITHEVTSFSKSTIKTPFLLEKNNGLIGSRFRSNVLPYRSGKNQTSILVPHGIKSVIYSSTSNKTDNSTKPYPAINKTYVINANETENENQAYLGNGTYSHPGKSSVFKELCELKAMRPVSSKAESGFSDSLCKILMEQSATQS